MRDADVLDQHNNGGCGDKWVGSGDNFSRQNQQNLLLEEICGVRDREELGVILSFCAK